MTGQGTSIFSKDGMVGKQFTSMSFSTTSRSTTHISRPLAEGAIGGTAQSIGGPLDKQGMVGKHFGADGSIGGTAQKLAEKNEQH